MWNRTCLDQSCIVTGRYLVCDARLGLNVFITRVLATQQSCRIRLSMHYGCRYELILFVRSMFDQDGLCKVV